MEGKKVTKEMLLEKARDKIRRARDEVGLLMEKGIIKAYEE